AAVTTMPRVTQEMPLVSAELGETLLRDQADLRREVLLWQRWVRYLALGALIVLSLIFGGSTIQEEIIPIGALSLVYVAINALTSWQLQRSASGWQVAWFPAFMVVADIATLAGFCYLTSAPMQAHRVLLLGFLS